MCSTYCSKLSTEFNVLNIDVHLSIKEHVFCLQVPADDAPLVTILHSRYQLPESGLILGPVAMVLSCR